jgi:hypothetical protein
MAQVFSITRKLLEMAFKAYWATMAAEDFGIGVPTVHWENAPFHQPADPWIRFTMQFAAGQQASLGSTPLEFQDGQVVVQVFTPKDIGTRTAALIADYVAAGLRYRQMTGNGVSVSAEEPQIISVGERDDVYQINVRVGFRAQHIAAVAA